MFTKKSEMRVSKYRSKQSRKIECYFVILNLKVGGLLLLKDSTNYYFPHIKTDEIHSDRVANANKIMKDKFGIQTFVLRRLYSHYDYDKDSGTRIYLLENISEDYEKSKNLVEVSINELPSLKIAAPSNNKSLLELILDELKDAQNDKQLYVWQKSGWFLRTKKWLSSFIESEKVINIDKVIQIKTGKLSCVLKIKTNSKNYYLKVLPDEFAYEVELTKFLSQTLTEYFPRVIYASSKDNLLLMEECRGETLDKIESVDTWKKALEKFARMQVMISERVTDIALCGCPDWRNNRLLKEISPFIKNIETGFDNLSEEEVARLNQRIPVFEELARQLYSYNIPDSIEHGDFWGGQVICYNGKFAFIDWSFASLSHPFFTLFVFFDYIVHWVKNFTEDDIFKLKRAYLKPWQKFEPLTELFNVFEISQRIAPLYYAIAYNRGGCLRLLLDKNNSALNNI